MSDNEVTLPKEQQSPEALEKQRLVSLIFSKQEEMTIEYKSLVRHTGALTSTSMVYAYNKAFNDIIKLLLKEQT